MSYVKLLSLFSNKMHFAQPRHLRYTDVTLYHIRVSLVLGLGLQRLDVGLGLGLERLGLCLGLDCVARCLDLEELSLESMPGVDPSRSLGSEPECPRISETRLYPSLIV